MIQQSSLRIRGICGISTIQSIRAEIPALFSINIRCPIHIISMGRQEISDRWFVRLRGTMCS